MAPNKINKYTKRCSICVFCTTKENKNGTKTDSNLSPQERGKAFIWHLLRETSLGFLVDRQKQQTPVCEAHMSVRIRIKDLCLPGTSDSMRHQPEPQRTLARPVSSARKSNTQHWETGSTANGPQSMPRQLIPGTKSRQR